MVKLEIQSINTDMIQNATDVKKQLYRMTGSGKALDHTLLQLNAQGKIKQDEMNEIMELFDEVSVQIED